MLTGKLQADFFDIRTDVKDKRHLNFFIVNSEQFNAFAAPSGLIFFNSGLIKTMQTEDQLLSVLAHEVAHIVSRHLSKRIAKQEKVSAASLLFGLASLAVGNPALTQGLFSGASCRSGW